MLKTFLDNKPLYYDKIDYTRMPRVYNSIKESLALPKIIHLVGTNGKGTTGRFLASALHTLGFSTGHYTSPHILEFNERIWLNGSDADNALLEEAHLTLLSLLDPKDAEALSYFEYTTLLAIFVYQECDYVVLEAGLGGEHDATAVFENILTLITPIDFDHEAFLGSDIESIATTKIRAVRTRAILAKQEHDAVLSVAEVIAEEKSVNIDPLSEFLKEDDLVKIKQVAKELRLAPYLEDNLMLSVAALNCLGLAYTPQIFKNARLFGRLSPIGENILVDVGHNTLAARSIYETLKKNKYILVYNSYKDKNYKEILQILKPIVLHVELIKVKEERIEEMQTMHKALEDLKIEYKDFRGVDKEYRYLVFGSFSVVEAFLKEYRE